MSARRSMRLRLLTPTAIRVDGDADKIVAEGLEGLFCLLPRHADLVSSLVPGLLHYLRDDREHHLAIDEGVLVKCGREVRVSTLNAVAGDDLDHLQRTVENEFRRLDERERVARSALARLEAGTLRRFMRLEEESRGRRP